MKELQPWTIWNKSKSGVLLLPQPQQLVLGMVLKSNFLVNLGYGDPAGVFPRLPRLSFDEAARIA